jgi:hypothetical protein
MLCSPSEEMLAIPPTNCACLPCTSLCSSFPTGGISLDDVNAGFCVHVDRFAGKSRDEVMVRALGLPGHTMA